MYYVYVAGYILLAAAMQLFTGNFPVSFLAFPLNIIFAAIWLFCYGYYIKNIII